MLFRFLSNQAESRLHRLNRSCRLSALRLAKRAVRQRVGGACALLSDLSEVGVRVGRCFSLRRKSEEEKRKKRREEKGEKETSNFSYFRDFLFLKTCKFSCWADRQTDGRTDRAGGETFSICLSLRPGAWHRGVSPPPGSAEAPPPVPRTFDTQEQSQKRGWIRVRLKRVQDGCRAGSRCGLQGSAAPHFDCR